MRINQENKTMDIEPREINFIMDALLTQYLFLTKNEMPEAIIFPMYKVAKTKRGEVPIQFVPDMSEIAQDIIEDGSNVAEVTPAQEEKLDEKDEEIKKLKAQVAELETTGHGGEEGGGTQTTEESDEDKKPAPTIGDNATRRTAESNERTSPAKAAFKVDPDPTHQPPPERKPNQPPGGDIGPGMPLSDMQGRDRRDQARTAKDLVEEPDIDESKEKDFDKTVSRDEQGRPVVEEKPDAPSGQ